MQIFIDSADINDIKEAKELGLADGVTTNPTLIMKSGRELKEAIEDIVKIVDGPVLAEVVSQDTEGIVKEGREFASWAENVVVKIPVTEEGLKAVKILRDEKIKTAVTLIFSVSQAILAAKAGADFICPFVGRLDDIGHFGMEIIAQIRDIYDNYDFETKILAASLRHPTHVLESALIGADVATIPPGIMLKLFEHPLTDKGLKKFLEDAESWKTK